MDVTYHLVDAISGDVIDGVTLPLQSVSLAHRFGGGVFSATLPLALDLTLTAQTELRWFRDLLPRLEPGTCSIAAVLEATDARAPVDLGEWLVWKTEVDHVTGDLDLSGFEWHGYPAMRALERDYVYNGRDVGQVACDLLQNCFMERQSGLALTIPRRDLGGPLVTLEQKRKTAYYDDLIDQVQDISPFEWFVTSHPVWESSVPARMAREVTLATSIRNVQSVELHAPAPGTPGGSILAWSETRDYAKAAASVFLFGKGQGDKQITADAANPSLLDGRHLIATRYETDSAIEDQAALDRRARALADEARSPVEAVQARVLLDAFPQLPSLGDVFPVSIEPRPSAPDGISGLYRVGQTTFRPSKGLEVIDLLMEPV